MAACHTFVHGTPEMDQADHYYVNRLVKTILWMKGGFRIYVAGDEDTCNYLKKAYSAGGEQDFDYDYMAGIFEHPFEVLLVDQIPAAKESPKKMGGHLEGCRIGFDAGGSDRKVSAVVDGESVYSEEVVWFPKVTADPDYHYEGIVAALKSAAAHMPRVDAVGVSSAGSYINNRAMSASLFLKVPRELYDAKVKDIYIRAVTDTFGDIPFEVVNDGAFVDGGIEFDRMITALGPLEGPADLDGEGCYIIPGLIDIHTHAAMGEDAGDGRQEGMPIMSRYYAAGGVTSW